MRFGTFITTYERPATLRATIEVLLSQTRPPDDLLVVDNGWSTTASAVVAEFDGVDYLRTGENLGSAGGAAYGMQCLYDRGCELIHLVDDDDPPLTGDTIERLVRLAERHEGDQFGGVAAAGTKWDWNTGRAVRYQNAELFRDLKVENIGGNTQLTVHRRVIERVGPPNPQHFFGFWDGLYSMRVRHSGLDLWVEGDLLCRYREEAGRLSFESKRSLVPKDPAYAVWRRYYVTRNYINDMRMVFGRPDLARREAGRALLRSAAAWRRGPRYGYAYSRFQVLGILDGYRSRLGQTVVPVRKPDAL